MCESTSVGALCFNGRGRTLTKFGSWITIAAKRQKHATREPYPSHPGEILQEQFLEPLGLTQVALSEHLGVPVQRINEIVRGKRGVTPETAWLLAQAFDTTPEFWISLQTNHDLAANRPSKVISPLRKAG